MPFTTSQPLTRRQFLALSGQIALAGGLLPGLEAVACMPRSGDLAGRVLRAATVYAHSDGQRAVTLLWPESTMPILDVVGTWYRVPEGYVAQADLQPMLPYGPEKAVIPGQFPAPVMVIAPSAPVWRWASGEAPIMTRVGYGGVLMADDWLADVHGVWYRVGFVMDGVQNTGWTLADRWTALPYAPEPAQAGADWLLRFDRKRRSLTVMQDGRRMAAFAVAVPDDTGACRGQVVERTLCGTVAEHPGTGWIVAWDGGMVYGAYWYNATAQERSPVGWGLMPLAARWVYEMVPVGASVEVT